MAQGVSGLAFRGRAEHRRNVAMTLDIRRLRKIELSAVGLTLAVKGRLQVFRGPRIPQVHDRSHSPNLAATKRGLADTNGV